MEALRADAVAPHMKACASQVKDLTASRAIHGARADLNAEFRP